jgi:phosphatidylglycerophosphate synthase
MPIINLVRQLLRNIARKFAAFLNSASKGAITPNSVTIFGLLMHLPIAWLIIRGDLLQAGIMLLVFGLFDTLDGELARLQNSSTAGGMFLDSVTDRFKEIIVYVAILWIAVTKADQIIVLSALAASLCVTYINAWGEAVMAKAKIKNTATNKLLRTGVASYDIRMFLIFVGLLTNKIVPLLYVVLILSIWTVGVRMRTVFSQLKRGES